MWLLDTNVVSELRKASAGREVASSFAAWARSRPAGLDFVSVVTIYELELGVRRIERRDADQGRVLRAWLDGPVSHEFRGRVITLDVDVMRRAAGLHIPDPRPERDAFIAATALHHGLGLVTRNTKDFASLGLELLNPWAGRSA
ncbi:type II toxin-antitoxin system VapC family toxin [Jiangella aurantiaca]|uniref:Type II toxin-antitoxin system VapC family toxin n=1 Tax=Jiangella aurantiaca TaxID=2530373 RepID=A0A4R5A735_9ACTN|nr:type II toxin-antitoxin system VapC family toxin [Jiangella aurantiaca]TDD66609.1 type II toxin-antitoxin system VapC family toxin [Jiangella aurantiaca]